MVHTAFAVDSVAKLVPTTEYGVGVRRMAETNIETYLIKGRCLGKTVRRGEYATFEPS
jgi:hypothetical protein